LPIDEQVESGVRATVVAEPLLRIRQDTMAFLGKDDATDGDANQYFPVDYQQDQADRRPLGVTSTAGALGF